MACGFGDDPGRAGNGVVHRMKIGPTTGLLRAKVVASRPMDDTPQEIKVEVNGVVCRLVELRDRYDNLQQVAHRAGRWVLSSGSDCWMDGQAAFILEPVAQET